MRVVEEPCTLREFLRQHPEIKAYCKRAFEDIPGFARKGWSLYGDCSDLMVKAWGKPYVDGYVPTIYLGNAQTNTDPRKRGSDAPQLLEKKVDKRMRGGDSVPQKRPLYIVHPFRGDGSPGSYQANLQAIRDVCSHVSKNEPEYLPISPVLTFSFLNDETDRVLALQLCRELLRLVISLGGEVRVYGDFESSEGCCQEIAWAHEFEAGPIRIGDAQGAWVEIRDQAEKPLKGGM